MAHILVTEAITGQPIEELKRSFEVTFEPDLWQHPERLKEILPGFEALIVRNQTQVKADLITAGNRLEVIARAGTGLDNIDVRAATQAGISVVSAPEQNAISVAEMTMGLILALARKIPAADRDTRQGGWERHGFTGVELFDATLGVVGLGRIGFRLALRARAFGMHIIAHDEYVNPDGVSVSELQARMLSLEQLLGQAEVEDAGVTEMMLMCSPVRDRGPARWHRDFYPPYCAPLQGYAEDIIENGPRYVQWNLPLYDDNVLWVVPGSHIRFSTEEENEQMAQDPQAPLSTGVQTHLKAGDGVAYILPILHWGSNYSTRMRRTIHGGFSMFSHYPDLSYLEHLSAPAQEAFQRWDQRSAQMMGHTGAALRAVIDKDGAAYHAALEKLHPGRGGKGKRQSTMFLSKAAKRINNLKRADFDELPDRDQRDATSLHPMTLQWGVPLADRFSPEEAQTLWQRFKPVDDSLQATEEQWGPGFQGGETRYYFNQVPAALSVESFIAGWSEPTG